MMRKINYLIFYFLQEGGGDANNPEKKARKRIKRSATVEKNIKNLNVAKFELEFDVDPLFKKTSSQVDILDPYKQCCGSGSTGSTCFWASWILLSLSKNSKKNLDFFCFETSFLLLLFVK
jgi:hypothetical protein